MIETIIHCDITSKDLRMIADKMEKTEKNAQVGDSVIAYEWILDSRSKIRFRLDQGKLQKSPVLDEKN